ncbi:MULTISPECIES: arylsulfatase [unclassified Achromobacter]|uniref:arylsulfatase n=1 Tax=unclassified Achromobacter TaxID=2626865 RepID=UPI000B51AE86|nr:MULTISPECIES: arylsulfatase [unclassified Achromobacter]OWT80142.1 arylsulfatase [Achromobacter sp. HZ34]OWT82025.1 arylsulfatase [Achromobacter sp. HZ28]
MKARLWLGAALFAAGGLAVQGGAYAQAQGSQAQEGTQAQGNQTQASARKPNILVIFGDDIGQANISAYTMGVVGYKTPNIDRIAREGTIFTDYYAENSCTAGRSSFITGQSPMRTGLSKVGIPGATVGLQDRDITIAQALKAEGYATAQFGKNHLGDRDEFLPTKHGFDEFFGNLYHLNAEEEPERPFFPKNPTDPLIKSYMPRGVIRATADGKIEDTGALTSKRMETIDDETVGAALDYLDKHGKGDKPFFVWMNTTRMHIYTHVRPEYRGKSGMPGNEYADGMWEHDQDVGKLLKKLDDLGIADNTIVVYSTDNGPNQFTWPDAATTPFRNEKDSNWEGAFRVPAMIRWPGHIPAGAVKNGMVSGMDWFPTLLAASGDAGVKDRLLKGWTPQGANQSYKVHLDGYNQLDYLTGKTDKSARDQFYYFNDDGLLVAMRYEDFKIVFCEQKAPGGFAVWQEPFVCLRVPKVFNLRMDPYERADVVSDQYNDWLTKNAYLAFIGTALASEFLETFKEFPPSQRPATFSTDQAQEELNKFLEKYYAEKARKLGSPGS